MLEVKQEIRIQAERQNLDDDFKIINQSIKTPYNISYSHFVDIEKQINNICKNKEHFSVKATVVVTPVLYYLSNFVKHSFELHIKEIVNYNNILIFNNDI